MRTSAYVCNQCKHPLVTNSVLIERLGLTRDDENFSERTWRRYINDAKPMPIAQLRRAVANAFAHGWIGLWQSLSTWQQIDRLQATQSGLRALLQRVTDRKAFLEHGQFQASSQELLDEFAKQLRLLEYATTDAINTRLRRNDLPEDERSFLIEVMAEQRQISQDGEGKT